MYGVEHYKYEGSWKKNMEDGYGTATWENVNEDADYRIIKYEGWWKKGEQHGHGKITWEKPYDTFPKEYENYLGWWKEVVFHGRGVHYLGYEKNTMVNIKKVKCMDLENILSKMVIDLLVILKMVKDMG